MDVVLNQNVNYQFKGFYSNVNICSSVFAIILISGWCQCAPISWNTPDYPMMDITSRYPRSQNFVVHPDFDSDNAQDRQTVRRATQGALSTSTSSAGKEMPESENNEVNFEMGNVTAISYAVNGFVRSAENIVRELLISTQTGLLRMIGQVDQGLDRFQKRLQNSTFQLAVAGQQAATDSYEALPPLANNIIQRIGMPADGRSREQLNVQLNEAVNNLRQVKKMFYDAWEEHEYDFHNVFQERFTQINQYLRVPNLPKRALGWY